MYTCSTILRILCVICVSPFLACYRQPFNFLTDKVVEITCQCLMAQADEAERNMLDDETSQRLIIEEFGRCLKEIIESAHKAEAT